MVSLGMMSDCEGPSMEIRRRRSMACREMDWQMPSWLEAVIPPHVFSIPPYVPGKPIEELQRELGIHEAVKMASNENPLGPSPLAMEAMREQICNVHVYPESSAPELREAIASRHGIPTEAVILGNGSDEIMALAAHVFIRPGQEAIMGSNCFSMYRIVVEAFGGEAKRIPLTNYRFNLDAMSRAVSERTRLIFLAIPNSPTGTIISRTEFESFLKELPKDGVILVVDEAYREYVAAPECPNGLDYLESDVPVLVLRTFSKVYGLAGLRIGYGMSRPWLIELLNRVRAPFNVSSMAQKAALAALNDQEHLRRSASMTSWHCFPDSRDRTTGSARDSVTRKLCYILFRDERAACVRGIAATRSDCQAPRFIRHGEVYSCHGGDWTPE
jgi:histidinol-phosphate aminotransferase